MKLPALVFAAFGLSLFFFSCGSTPKDSKKAVNHIETQYTADPSEAVSIAVPQKKQSNFFAGIPAETVRLIENGSPASIKQAFALLRKDSSLYQENEKILLAVGRSIMNILWPSENINLENFDISSQNSYLGAIESAKQGIYDESTGNSDFLTLVLPSLVLVTSEARNDYYALSAQSLDKALELNEESVLANYLRGVLYRRMGEYSLALKYFQKAYNGSPDTLELIYSLSYINLKNSNYDTAISQAKLILGENPIYTPALKICAESYFNKNNLEESELYVGRVLQQEPENSSYLLFRAKILIQKGDYIRAASLLDVYARKDSQSREYLVLRTKVQKDWNKNITAAASTIEKAFELYPDDSGIILTAASLAFETGTKINGKSAGELASMILQKDENNVEALIIQVEDLVVQKKWGQAYDVSSKLIKLKNIPDSAVYTHITICLNAGKKNEAWDLSVSLYNKNPKDESVLQNYIKTLISTGRTSEASKLISLNLETASAKLKSFLFYQRSLLQSSQEAVLVDLRSSLTANPRNKDALFRLYKIYYEKKEYRKAQYYLKQVVSLSPSDENLLKLNSELEALLSK